MQHGIPRSKIEGEGKEGVQVKEREKMRICYFKSYLKSPARIITRELYTKHIVPSHQKAKIILKATREKLLMTYKGTSLCCW